MSTALTVSTPTGAHWSFEEVRTKAGAESLGEVPILVWDSLDAMRDKYGDEGVLAMADGTSPRVSYQSIARRGKMKGKTDDQIAQEQLDFRPGKRGVGESTPASRVRRAASAAVDKGVDPDKAALLLDKLARGEIDIETLLGAGV